MSAKRTQNKQTQPSNKLVRLQQRIGGRLRAIGLEQEIRFGGSAKSFTFIYRFTIISMLIHKGGLQVDLHRTRANITNVDCEYTFKEDGSATLAIGDLGPIFRKGRTFTSWNEAFRHLMRALVKETERIGQQATSKATSLQLKVDAKSVRL